MRQFTTNRSRLPHHNLAHCCDSESQQTRCVSSCMFACEFVALKKVHLTEFVCILVWHDIFGASGFQRVCVPVCVCVCVFWLSHGGSGKVELGWAAEG